MTPSRGGVCRTEDNSIPCHLPTHPVESVEWVNQDGAPVEGRMLMRVPRATREFQITSSTFVLYRHGGACYVNVLP